MSRILPYVVFAPCYVVLGMVFSIPMDFVSSQAVQTFLEFAAFLAAAPVAILIARRMGPLSAPGLFWTGLIVAAVLYTLIWGTYQWQSVQAGSSIPFWRVAQMGGRLFAASMTIQILAPAVWRILMSRPSNSSGQNPLRGVV